MSKKSRALAPAVAAFVASDETPTLADVCEALPTVDAEVAADIAKKGSVVRTGYKKLYAARAAEAGLGKVAQRSCWDWLAQELAAEVLVDGKLHEERMRSLLSANGIRHEHWGTGEKRTKGWEGRLRMTGRLALQRVVAKNGHLATAEGAMIEAPAEWIAKHTH
jgi:hypothetical protein